MIAAIAATPLFILVQAASPQAPQAPPRPASFTHADQIAAYASASVSVAQAEKVCPAFRRNVANLTKLRSWMEIKDADKAELARQTAEAERKISAQIKSVGAAAWCESIAGLFGPEGNLARGLLDAK